MSNEIRVLYTAEAVAQDGRAGHARTSDGRLDVDLDVPTEMGGSGGPGTNPEQLFAVGYAACFQSALLRHAASRKHDLTGTRITARVGSARCAPAASVFRRRSTSTRPGSATSRPST